MARVAPRVPETTDVLCEKCGYVLNGLPPDGRCPECGKPVAESVGDGRLPTPWDVSANPGPSRLRGFVRTTVDVILRPTHFYRTLAVRASVASARTFAQVNWWIASLLFGVSGAAHALWYNQGMRPASFTPVFLLMFAGFTLGLAIFTYLVLDGLTRLAGRLTYWEGTYRGYRLPYPIVLRGLYYHTPHYLPVAAATAVTVLGYQALLLTTAVSIDTATKYLYFLCIEVIVGALYLFQTYWIGMRNMMYANR